MGLKPAGKKGNARFWIEIVHNGEDQMRGIEVVMFWLALRLWEMVECWAGAA